MVEEYPLYKAGLISMRLVEVFQTPPPPTNQEWDLLQFVCAHQRFEGMARFMEAILNVHQGTYPTTAADPSGVHRHRNIRVDVSSVLTAVSLRHT